MSTPDGYSMKEALSRVESKLDALAVVVAAGQIAHATLEPRVIALEKNADRRWSLVPTWIASGLALVLAVAPLIVR